MMYAKFVDGQVCFAPSAMDVGGVTHYNPPEAMLLDAGYLPVMETPCPDDGKTYAGGWEQQHGRIVRVWRECEPPEPAPSPDQAILSRLSALEAQNELLLECLLEMSAIVYEE